jgi:hypothetical protein
MSEDSNTYDSPHVTIRRSGAISFKVCCAEAAHENAQRHPTTSCHEQTPKF